SVIHTLPARRHTVALVAGVFAALFLTIAARADQPLVCGAAIDVPDARSAPLEAFAREIGLKQIDAFVGTVAAVRRTGHVPACYLTKRAAQRLGWRPGRDLWAVAPGTAIGGDRFGNREGRLPAGKRYIEADLDYEGGERGAHRLIFSEGRRAERQLWVTVDHYQTFHAVPAP
ncbi:MAG: ribonuclease domain-containing protein, partial [Candidatus Eiseniibacteriota bacterium]